jgi:hypothetical protein
MGAKPVWARNLTAAKREREAPLRAAMPPPSAGSCPEVLPPIERPTRPVHTERDFFIDDLLVQIHCIIVMIRWTGLALWEVRFPFPGSRIYTFLGR